MHQKKVSNRTERGQRRPLIDCHRLIATIAARHHERTRDAVEQEMMHRRRWKHDAECELPGSNTGREIGRIAARNKHDGALARLEHRPFRDGGAAQGIRASDIAHHDGERLGIPALQGTQSLDGGSVCGIAREMVSAQRFDGHDSAVAQRFHCRSDRVTSAQREYACVARNRLHFGTAVPAADGFGVKPSIIRIVVLRATCGTHRERCHGRALAIVRRVTHDSQARPAVGAGNEWVAIASVRRVAQLREAAAAGCDVRRHTRSTGRRIGGVARRDPELAVRTWRSPLDPYPRDRRQWRRFKNQGTAERVHAGPVTFDVDGDAMLLVAHKTTQPIGRSKAMDVGPEAHALHDALNRDQSALHPVSSLRSVAGCLEFPPVLERT